MKTGDGRERTVRYRTIEHPYEPKHPPLGDVPAKVVPSKEVVQGHMPPSRERREYDEYKRRSIISELE